MPHLHPGTSHPVVTSCHAMPQNITMLFHITMLCYTTTLWHITPCNKPSRWAMPPCYKIPPCCAITPPCCAIVPCHVTPSHHTVTYHRTLILSCHISMPYCATVLSHYITKPIAYPLALTYHHAVPSSLIFVSTRAYPHLVLMSLYYWLEVLVFLWSQLPVTHLWRLCYFHSVHVSARTPLHHDL